MDHHSSNNVLDVSPSRMSAIRNHIKDMWSMLTRSHSNLIQALLDPKIKSSTSTESFKTLPLYISDKESEEGVLEKISRSIDASLINILTYTPQISKHGLLYLPNTFVVPGGRFNEMYNWDSYFIILGLIKDGEIELAKGMVDNFKYEIEHYGTILNANRTYYLSRSQPPFYTQSILAVYQSTRDEKWLSSFLPSIREYYSYFTSEPHVIKPTGEGSSKTENDFFLSRYLTKGEGPCPEVESEIDEKGNTYYENVKQFYRDNQNSIDCNDVSKFYDKQTNTLTPLFYQGDRGIRESGFDLCNRFGTFGVDIINYAPVCLNSFLFKMENDICFILEHLLSLSIKVETTFIDVKDEVNWFKNRANKRKELINRFLWDEDLGLYFDYNFETHTQNKYEFVTTFLPLWAGLASPHQAEKVVANLSKFEALGGVFTSSYKTGCQWDKPYGWAPLQLLVVKALQNYSYIEQADRIARKFCHLVLDCFEDTGCIVEKYDLEVMGKDTSVKWGYISNEIGFGWTNGVFLELLDSLSQKTQEAA